MVLPYGATVEGGDYIVRKIHSGGIAALSKKMLDEYYDYCEEVMSIDEYAMLVKVNLKRDGTVESFHCPACNKKQGDSHAFKKRTIYCWNCGQRIRWGKWKWKNKE